MHEHEYAVFMFVPCINSIKPLLLFHNDAHNHKITGILKQLKIPTVAPTCFGSLMVPWWWFIREPKHVGATVGIFNCFNIPVILWLYASLWNNKSALISMQCPQNDSGMARQGQSAQVRWNVQTLNEIFPASVNCAEQQARNTFCCYYSTSTGLWLCLVQLQLSTNTTCPPAEVGEETYFLRPTG
jgi:hypothetical protein